MNSTICLNPKCFICETVKRSQFMRNGFDDYASMTIQEINRVYFTDMKDDDAMCKDCECFHDCKCAMESLAEPKREKKTNQKFRPQRATPKGEGHRWKAVEKTTTTWGSPADKARKREVMAVKQQRKWREAFVSEEYTHDLVMKGKVRDHSTSEFVEYNRNGCPQTTVQTVDAFLPEYENIKPLRIHRGPIRDRPCKPGFVEYTGKGWPKC